MREKRKEIYRLKLIERLFYYEVFHRLVVAHLKKIRQYTKQLRVVFFGESNCRRLFFSITNFGLISISNDESLVSTVRMQTTNA